MGRSKLEKLIGKRIGQGIYKYKLIEPGDRILVAVSGGKDSMTLLHDFIRRQPSFPIPFEFEVVHVQSEFCTCCKEGELEQTLKAWQVPYHIIPVPVIGRLQEGRKMNCYWCTTQRRMELLKLSKARGCNKIAFGHHLDDIVETLLMNICYNGEVSGMLPKFKYDKFSQTVIRPLTLLSEKLIIKFAAEQGIKGFKCECGYDNNSKRRHVRAMIQQLAKEAPAVRMSIFRAMGNVKPEYLLDESLFDALRECEKEEAEVAG